MEDVAYSFILLWIMGLNMVVLSCPDKCQCNLEYFVYCRSVTLTDAQFSSIISDIPSKARLLDLGSNNLVNISSNIFLRFPNLEYLNLSDNQITQIDNGAFRMQEKLRDLNLKRNLVSSLSSGTFKGLSSVKTIYLESNNIQSIGLQTFSGLAALQQLYLQNNKLVNISSHFFEGLDDLHLLDLSNNEISLIGEASFSHLKSLWDLRLNNNQLRDINAKSFDDLISIRVLDISHNNISDINFFASCQFRETIGSINLSHNSLHHIPAHVVSTIRRLATLDLSENKISSISRGAFFGLSLLKLNLSENTLMIIDRGMFSQIRKIVHLDLSYNDIEVIKTGSFDSFRETVYYLNLQNNFLTEVNTGMFRGMKNLLVLKLDNNDINNIHDGSFQQLVKLEDLSISHNKLTVVRASMLKGPPLQSIYLQCNALEKFMGFKFEDQKSEINIHFNMSVQEQNELSARVIWPYREGSQIYWRVILICISDNNCSEKPPGHQEFLPPYKTETVLTNLTPISQYYICVYPVFLNKNIHIEQCIYFKTQPGRALTTATVKGANSQPAGDNGITSTHDLSFLTFPSVILSWFLCRA